MAGLETWWAGIPIITRWLFALSMGITLGANFGVIPPMYIILDMKKVIYSLEVWRIITCFFYHGRLGFPFLIHMMFLLRYGQSLEQETFAGRTADYVFFLLFGCTILLVVGFFMSLPILGMAMIMMLIYLWSRKNPNITMSFLFGIQFQSFYFPWVLVGFNVLMGGFPMVELLGIIVGHLYYFLEDIYPRTGGVQLLKTPQFMYNLFPPAFGTGYQAPQQQQTQQQQRRGHDWGRGHSLGND